MDEDIDGFRRELRFGEHDADAVADDEGLQRDQHALRDDAVGGVLDEGLDGLAEGRE